MTNVMWKYVDKKAAAVAAIKDYQSMQYILQHTDKDIASVEESMTSISSISMERSTKTNNASANEDRIIKNMERINVLKVRYQEAKEYMEWFEPAWDSLKEEERHVLGEFYWGDDEYKGVSVIDILCEEYNIERTSVYKRKNRALDKLTTRLYGSL